MIGRTLHACRDALERGEATSRMLVARAQDLAREAEGEGARVFIELNAHALDDALEMDRVRGSGRAPSPWAGIPVSVKDLFDVTGEVTRAGSRVLETSEPAAVTAPAIQRLLDAGLVIVGRTNMTEFAYSGVGLNPHYGTPLNPWDRANGRIPGGSSSGAAISVTDGMAVAGIGTDTGGSCRIPAALTGLTGWKPTAARVPREGVYPLSVSLDSVGVLAVDVAGCAVLDDLMAGGPGTAPEARTAETLNLAVLDHYVTDDMDAWVAGCYERALEAIRGTGARLTGIRLPAIERLPGLNARGGIAAAEAYAFHRDQLADLGDGYDPRVAGRILAGAEVDAQELADIRAARAEMIHEFGLALEGYDGLITPTVPIVAPELSAFAADEEYARLNQLLLRNPSLFNFLDGCAISLPVHPAGTAPVGLMLAAPAGRDVSLLGTALGLETVFSGIDNVEPIA